MALIRSLAPLALAAALLPCDTAHGQTVNYAKWGGKLLEQHDVALESLGDKLEPLITAGYAHMDLGMFDARFPAYAIADSKQAERLQSALISLVDVQLSWVRWTVTDSKVASSLMKPGELIKKWLRSWKMRKLTGLGAQCRDLVQDLEAKEKVLEALAAFAEGMRSGIVIGETREEPRACRIIFSPTRTDFIGVLGVLGMVDEFYRGQYWIDVAALWTDVWLYDEGDAQVIALEYASPFQDGNPTLAFDMNTRESTGLQEHVIQRAGFSLMFNEYGADCYHIFKEAVAQNLAIDVVGQNNARSGGSGASNVTEARDVFVPGAPGDGILPPNNADSLWRESLGKNHFIQVLSRETQRPAKTIRDKKEKIGWYELWDDTKSQRHMVRGPFLGVDASESKELIPQAFLNEYLEFHRAYKSGFLHWLQTVAGGKGKKSAQKFAELLRSQVEASGPAFFEEKCAEIYKVPFSAPSPDSPSLEWEFLKWLLAQ